MFYYEKLVGYIPSSFADLVFMGERIEVGLNRRKFNYVALAGPSNRRFGASGAKKMEGEAHAVTSAPTWPKPQQTPHNTYQYAQHQPSFSARGGNPSSPVPIQQRAPAQPQRAPIQNSSPTQPRPVGSSNPSTSANPRRNFPVKKTCGIRSHLDVVRRLATIFDRQPNGGGDYQEDFPVSFPSMVQPQRDLRLSWGCLGVLDRTMCGLQT